MVRGRCLEGLESVCIVSGLSLEGVWKVIGSFLDQVDLASTILQVGPQT